MEQKQLDEIDDSYFGDEFVEEDSAKASAKAQESVTQENSDSSATGTDVEEDVKVEKVQLSAKKAASKRTTRKKSSKKAAKSTEDSQGNTKEAKESTDASQTLASQKEETTSTTVPTSTPVDPWANEENDGPGLFSQTSTWKALAGILLILLVYTVYTQGTPFGENAITGDVVAAPELTLAQAELKALAFVNSQLLQPPFVAEVVSSQDTGNLFQVTLSVAGQPVDSYITKDGSLFFPQGFDLAEVEIVETTEEELAAQQGEEAVAEQEEGLAAEELALEEEAPLENEESEEGTVEESSDAEVAQEAGEEETTEESTQESEDTASEESEEAPAEESEDAGTDEVSEEPAVEEEVVEAPSVPAAQATLSAKKWLFNPHTLTVKAGEPVALTIEPEGLDFTFAIPELGVEQEVSGATVVEFTAGTTGEFEFSCSSCEDFRGMTGTLVVE